LTFFSRLFPNLNPLIGWLTIIRIVAALGFAIFHPFLGIYLHEELGISMTKVGLMLMISGIIGTLSGPFGGSLSDRIGRKKLLSTIYITRAIVFFSLALLVFYRQPFFVFAAFWMIGAIMGSASHPILDAIIADIIPIKFRAEAYSLMKAGVNIGWAIGPVIGGIVFVWGYHYPLGITAISLVIASVLIVVKLPETRSIKSGEKSRHTIKILKDDPHLAQFLVFFICMSLLRGQLSITLSMHLSANLGMSKPFIGLIYMVNAAMVIILQVPVMRYIVRFNPLLRMLAASLIYTAGYFLIGQAGVFAMVILAIVIITTAEIIESPTAAAYVSSMAPSSEAGAYMGAHSMANLLGWLMGPLVGGLVLDNIASVSMAWTTISMLGVVAAVGYTWLMIKDKNRLKFDNG